MIELSRTVRFFLSPPGNATGIPAKSNTYSAWPPLRGLGRYYEMTVRCGGSVDPVTGYLMNITHIDRAVREHVLPLFESALAADPTGATTALGSLLQKVVGALQPALGDTVQHVILQSSPHVRLSLGSSDLKHATIRQEFEFAAAHRLHVPHLSDEENHRIFGKCNNQAGHGHNYRLQVAIRVPVDPEGRILSIEAMDDWVSRTVVAHLDHKNLNVDVPQFRDCVPSVENITVVIWDMLTAHLGDLGDQVELEEISVWETEKTVCTYRG